MTVRPIFRWRPERVSGIPILRDIRAFAPLIPTKRFHEKPPLFMSLGDYEGGPKRTRNRTKPRTEGPRHEILENALEFISYE